MKRWQNGLAERFGIADPAGVVGRNVRLTTPMYGNRGQTGKAEEAEVIGMIRNERIREAQAPMQEVVYVSVLQAPRRELKLLVRTRTDAPATMPAIRAAVGEIDPRLPLGDIKTMAQVKQLTLAGSTEPAWIIGVFAGVAALLAALGLYGVLSHAVSQRRREILFEVSALDPLAFTTAAMSMAIVGLAAALVPASRATRVDPVTALRAEG
jgi:hypothetical protein